MAAPNLNDLYYFVQVVDHGGFSPAGRALGIAKSKLSRRVGELGFARKVGERRCSPDAPFDAPSVPYRYWSTLLPVLQGHASGSEAAQQFIGAAYCLRSGHCWISSPNAMLYLALNTDIAHYLADAPSCLSSSSYKATSSGSPLVFTLN